MKTFAARIFLLTLALCTPVWAWWDTGHELVARTAEQHIAARTRQEIIRILRHHPDPSVRTLVAASAWPDDIKKKDHPFHSYEHSNWHYQNRPIETTGDFGADNGEMVQRLKENIEVLGDVHRAPAERAVALCWVAHLVGDIHQPLHNSNSFRPEFLPRGDEGGNRFKVWLGSHKISLHNLWDSAGARFLHHPSQARLLNYLVWFQHVYPPSSFVAELRITDPQIWSDEGLALAREKAYAHVVPGEQLSDEAYQEVLDTTERQLPLAGYRLARVLDCTLGGGGP